jgi:hypothetical protein
MRQSNLRRGTLSAWIATLAILAAPVGARASELAWEGTLSLDFVHPSLPDTAVTGSGVAHVEGVGGGVHLEHLRVVGGLSGTATLPVTATGSTTFTAVQVAMKLGSGSLGPFAPAAPSLPQLTQASLPVSGFARLCVVFSDCGQGITLGLTASSAAVGLGVGGTLTAGAYVPPRISVQAAPWTVATATLPVFTASGAGFVSSRAGWRHGAVSFTSSTAAVGGALSLVTPLAVTSEAGTGFNSFARMTLRFVPEPGGGLALGTGSVLLLGLGAHARSRNRP